jgi:hypothetical protein
MSAARSAQDEVAGRLEETLAALDKALRAPPARLKAETHEALRAAVRLRDLLIERRRQAATPEEQVADRATLDHVNVAISLLVAVEYPIEKMQRQDLEQARGVLQGLVAAGRL